MAKVKVQINERELGRLYRQVAANIDAADRAFRSTHEGYPLDVVEADARSAIPGVELDSETLHRYAQAVSEGEPFVFKLR